MYGIVLKTAPALEPIEVEDAKKHCRIEADNHDDDDYVGALISAAREWAEGFTARSFITQVWDLYLDSFPGFLTTSGYTAAGRNASPSGWVPGYGRTADQYFANGIIQLPRNPVQSVAFIKYVDAAGVQQTLDPGQYVVDTTRIVGRLAPIPTSYWPVTQPSYISPALNIVTVEFTAGYGDGATSVPAKVIHAMKLVIGHWYANREEVIAGSRVAAINIPTAAEMLLWSERILEAA